MHLVPWSTRFGSKQSGVSSQWDEAALHAGGPELFGNHVGDMFAPAHRGFNVAASDVPTSLTFTRINL
jgi:hypothetical protein